jgi:HSP20 family molecular chaperone IbpA
MITTSARGLFKDLLEGPFSTISTDYWYETPTYSNNSTTYVPNKFAVDVKEDIAHIALSVIGHDAENVEINCFEDKIEVKAKKGDKVKDDTHPLNQLTGNIDETIKLAKTFDGRKATAEIKNGILLITVERKEESKPKKLTPKVG